MTSDKKSPNASKMRVADSLILHIGAPKCASSFLQSSLLLYQKSLESCPYFYPDSGKWSRGFGRGNSGPLYWIFEQASPSRDDFLPSLEELWRMRQGRNLIISDEEIYGFITSCKLNAFSSAALVSGFSEVKIVLSVRKPTDWLISDYSEHLRQGIPCDLNPMAFFAVRLAYCDWEAYVRSRLLADSANYSVHTCDSKELVLLFEELLDLAPGGLTFSNVNEAMPRMRLSDSEIAEAVAELRLKESKRKCVINQGVLDLSLSAPEIEADVHRSLGRLSFLDERYEVFSEQERRRQSRLFGGS